MMNKIWGGIIIISVAVGIISGNGNGVSKAVIDGAENAAGLIITIGAAMCLWSGIMNIASQSGLTDLLAKAFSPVLEKLFPEYSDDKNVSGAICMNITANLLGLGNAATPLGIEAMKRMQRKNTLKDKANKSMIMFVVINTASLQLIPTTIATLRRNAGSENPMEILPYVWICSAGALAVGIIITTIINKLSKS